VYIAEAEMEFLSSRSASTLTSLKTRWR